MVGEYPLGEHAGVEGPVNRRHQYGSGPIGEPVAGDYLARELVVGSILDDDLDFVARCEPVEICPIVLSRFTASRTFDIDNLQNASRNPRDGPMTSGLQHHRPAAGAQADRKSVV